MNRNLARRKANKLNRRRYYSISLREPGANRIIGNVITLMSELLERNSKDWKSMESISRKFKKTPKKERLDMLLTGFHQGYAFCAKDFLNDLSKTYTH